MCAVKIQTRRVLFLTKYARRAASTRFRVLQYLPYFERAGLECEVRPLLSDAYLEAKLEEGRIAGFEVLKGVTRRLLSLRTIQQFALVVIHMEAIPFLPPFFEQTLVRAGVRYVYDFDDASFHQYDMSRHWLLRAVAGKIGRVIRGASLVTAGNEYLAAYARQFNPRVVVVPTVVDVDNFVPRSDDRTGRPVIIGWIGSPPTAIYVQDCKQVWRAVTADGRCLLRLVGSGRVGLDGIDVDVRPWHESRETSDIQDFDIGVMPLRDDPWSRGKCGFKLIEYMACGLPAVASPVGVNRTIVIDGENGFLCNTVDEWARRLRQLVNDPRLRQSMGERGRRLACEQWSLQRWGPRLTELLVETAAHEHSPETSVPAS